MKGLKRFLSLILVVLMAFSVAPSAFAWNAKVLVVGTDGAKQKFRTLLGTHANTVPSGFAGIDRGITFTYSPHDDFNCGDNYIVIAAVDADQNIDTVEREIKGAVDCICDSKDDYTEIIVVGCTTRRDVPGDDRCFACISNRLTHIKQDCSGGRWGSRRNKAFEHEGFLHCLYQLDQSKEGDLMKLIVGRWDNMRYRCLIM